MHFFTVSWVVSHFNEWWHYVKATNLMQLAIDDQVTVEWFPILCSTSELKKRPQFERGIINPIEFAKIIETRNVIFISCTFSYLYRWLVFRARNRCVRVAIRGFIRGRWMLSATAVYEKKNRCMENNFLGTWSKCTFFCFRKIINSDQLDLFHCLKFINPINWIEIMSYIF